jgi:hypothetical protein
MNMKKLTAVLAAAGLICATSGIALASATATQMVTYEVAAINELSVSGSPGSLTVSTATAGDAPDAVSDATTTYAITTNETGRKITGALNTAMPDGVTLTATLAAPTGGSSVSAVTLSTVAADLVTGITTLNESGKAITFGLSATSAAGVVPSAVKTVTLTITAEG